MSRLRAITARFGVGPKRNPGHAQAEVAAAASATTRDQSDPGADHGDVDNSATSDAPSLAELEAHGPGLREGGQPTAPDAALAPDASPAPQGKR